MIEFTHSYRAPDTGKFHTTLIRLENDRQRQIVLDTIELGPTVYFDTKVGGK